MFVLPVFRLFDENADRKDALLNEYRVTITAQQMEVDQKSTRHEVRALFCVILVNARCHPLAISKLCAVSRWCGYSLF